jgi:hypothetical protein
MSEQAVEGRVADLGVVVVGALADEADEEDRLVLSTKY